MNTYRKSIYGRFVHANRRLASRYGVTISFEEYLRLNAKFASPDRKNLVRGLRIQNEHGDLEGWIKVRGQWVCAHYKRQDGLIATFLPKPLTTAPCPKCDLGEDHVP